MDCIVRLGNGRAIGRARVNVFVIRAFIKMRETLRAAPELAGKLAALKKKLTARLDVHEAAIVQVLQEVMQILNPPPTQRRSDPHRIHTLICRPWHAGAFRLAVVPRLRDEGWWA
jgi:hypothetical protein